MRSERFHAKLAEYAKDSLVRRAVNMSFKIVPLSKEFTTKVLAKKRDDFGNDIIEQVAAGYGPCRLSLKPFVPGVDRRVLISHSPFTVANAFNQPGPVFINPAESEYADVDRFPPEIKADKKNFPLTLIGYSNDQRMVFAQLVGDRDVDQMIGQIFDEREDIEYLHARNAEAGCFICKIERVDNTGVHVAEGDSVDSRGRNPRF